MAETTTTRPINLGQLGGELGTPEAPVDLSMEETDGVRTVTCLDESVTEQQLATAVAAHTPGPPPPTDAEVIANLRARLTVTEQTLDQIIIDALMGDFPPL